MVAVHRDHTGVFVRPQARSTGSSRFFDVFTRDLGVRGLTAEP
ncbi:hypothetical protein ACWGE0_37230 [Lentzea sp. NPDC054927]